MAPAPAPDVPGFAVEGPLGRGGFGRVFSARRVGDGREVALKVLEPLASERLGREVEALRRIGPPAAPQWLGEATASTGEPVVVMERIHGLTLARRLAELPGPGALRWAEAAPLMRVLAEAVGRMHAVAVVHRDLKPENVMLSGGRLVLLDFGLARLGAAEEAVAPGPGLTRTGQRLGTHEYMSPEQCRDARVLDARADLYSLGVVYFELLCGRPPFVGDTAAVQQGHVSRRPPPLRELAPWPVPAPVEALVQRLLAKDPEERFPSAVALAEALGRVPDGAERGPVKDTGAGTVGPVPSGDGKSPREVALLGVRTSMEVPALLAQVGASGAELARVEAGLAVFAFPHAVDVEAGLRAALRAAEALGPVLPAGSLRAIHCAPLRMRERGGRVTVGGAALERPERWWPREADPGGPEGLTPDTGSTQGLVQDVPPALTVGSTRHVPVVSPALTVGSTRHVPVVVSPALTPASTGHVPVVVSPALTPQRLAQVERPVSPSGSPRRPAQPVPPALTPEARARLGHADTERTPALAVALPAIDATLGREAELAWLHDGLARVRDSGAPALRTLLGEEGLGKTRLLTAWHRELRGTPGVSALFVEALPDEGSASESGLRNLITTLLGLPPSTPPDEAVRHLLVDAADAATAHPAARRQLIARALASRLWRLAEDRPLVLLVDDAHTLDPTALDALELATLAEVRAPVCVVLAGRHRLLGLRPYLGERARDFAQWVLPPLEEGAARELLRQLLRPVDLIAEGVLRELVDRCGGSPLHMMETVRALRAAGAIRAQPGGGAYLATDAVHGLGLDSPRPDELLAERNLAALPSGLRSVLQVAALLGDEVRLEELTATLASLEADSALDLSMDPGVALERLERAGLLEAREPRRWRFEHATLREAFGAQLPTAARQRICAAALKALPHAATARRARLAEGAGDLSQALGLHRTLAEDARRAHRLLEAERHYSAALELLRRGDDAVRLALLSGRGRVRYRLQRIDDALADLRAARTLAEAQGDVVREADLLLEEATALDWQDDPEGSTALLEQALRRLGDSVPPELAARHALARARVVVRSEDITGAVPPLERAVEAARTGGDTETEAIALAMLGAMLAWTGHLEDSAKRFDEAIALCEATGDTLHLGVALNNRMVLRVQRRDVDGAREDLERAVSLGRELGNVQIERTSAFNLALLLGYQGRAVEALPLARRAGLLSQRFFPGSMAQDALLVARLCCELGDMAEAARQLTWLEEPSTQARLLPGDQLMLSVVQRVVGEARGALPYGAAEWAELLETARRQATPDERMEILVWAARAARAAGDDATVRARAEEVEETAREAPLWTERVRALVSETQGTT